MLIQRVLRGRNFFICLCKWCGENYDDLMGVGGEIVGTWWFYRKLSRKEATKNNFPGSFIISFLSAISARTI